MKILKIAISLSLLAAPLQAAGPKDPDWPCIQRRQPALSIPQIWPGPPLGPEAETLAQRPDIRELGARIALRRTSMEEAKKLIDDFAAGHTPAEIEALFLATFNPVQTARGRVMAGITRYAHKQAQLDAEINAQRRQLDALLSAEAKDFDAIDKAEIAVDWSTRIFQDRQQSLTYVCETPVVLEQRAFALARLYAAALKAR